jgi:hypothetical protein
LLGDVIEVLINTFRDSALLSEMSFEKRALFYNKRNNKGGIANSYTAFVSVSAEERFCFSPKCPEKFWGPPVPYLMGIGFYIPGKN